MFRLIKHFIKFSFNYFLNSYQHQQLYIFLIFFNFLVMNCFLKKYVFKYFFIPVKFNFSQLEYLFINFLCYLSIFILFDLWDLMCFEIFFIFFNFLVMNCFLKKDVFKYFFIPVKFSFSQLEYLFKYLFFLNIYLYNFLTLLKYNQHH